MNITNRPSQMTSSFDLQQRISKIYDHLYATSRTRTPAGISREVGKILHAAMYLEEFVGRCPAFSFSRGELKILNGGNSLTAIEEAQNLRKNFSQMNNQWKLYEKDPEIEIEDQDIAYVCAQLSGISISDKNRDVFGDALEIFRSQWAKREGGQFFTDQRVTSLAMTLLEFDPRKGDDLIDICAGTGGFLLAGINHIRQLLERDSKGPSVEKDLIRLASKALKGQEVDDQVCKIANATLGARLNAGKQFVLHGDSLKPDSFVNNDNLKVNSHLCAASNPPFGTKITIKDERILRQFDLAKGSSLKGNSGKSQSVHPRPPDILFLEQNIKMLKPGKGRLAIVLPYQILSGPQMLYVRHWLLCQTEVLAVVDLPNETFQPHTGTKTCLLVVRRRERPLSSPAEDGPPVFMAIPRWIGHDRRGNPIFKKSVDGKVLDEVLTDFDDVDRSFRIYKSDEGTDSLCTNSFVISPKAIIADPLLRLNALFHKPTRGGTAVDSGKKVSKDQWKKARINEVVEKIFYPTRFKRNYIDYREGAVPFLGGSNITELLVTGGKWLSPEDSKLKHLTVKAGWILVTRSGSTGIISSVPPAWDGVAMSEHIIRIVPNPAKLDPGYLQAFLRSKYCQEIIAKGVFGSVIDEITPEFLGEIEILIPKSKTMFKSIADQMREGEKARQNATEKFLGAIDVLEKVLP